MYFGASLAPRMEQAASQIQDSRDLGGRSLGMKLSGLQEIKVSAFERIKGSKKKLRNLKKP